MAREVKRDPVAAVQTYNARFIGRYPFVLREKIRRMSMGPFEFYRGSFHLFARDFAVEQSKAPLSGKPWRRLHGAIIADLHLHNFGTYPVANKTGGKKHLRYDVTDFDECTVGPLWMDLIRLGASFLLLAEHSEVPIAWGPPACRSMARAYCESVLTWKSAKEVRAFGIVSKGPIAWVRLRKFLEKTLGRRRKDFLGRMTVPVDKGRALIRDAEHYDLKPVHRKQAERLVQVFLRNLGSAAPFKPKDMMIEDVCGRIAGCGSLGRLSYLALLKIKAGNGKTRRTLILLKEVLPSGWDEARGNLDVTIKKARAPVRERAGRIVAQEKAMLGVVNAFLGYGEDGPQSFLVRELGGRYAKLPDSVHKSKEDWMAWATCQGRLLARCHLQGSAFKPWSSLRKALAGREQDFEKDILETSEAFARRTVSDFKVFKGKRLVVQKALMGKE